MHTINVLLNYGMDGLVRDKKLVCEGLNRFLEGNVSQK